MRKLVVLALLFVASVAFLGAYPAAGIKKPAFKTALGTPQEAALASTQDRPGTIDGAVTPDLIPDDVAYGLFFGFLAGRETQEQKNSVRSFFRQRPQLAGIDADALMMVANEFQEASKALEDDEKTLAAASHHRSSILDAKVALLKQRKLNLVNEKVGVLPSLIGNDGAEKVRLHVMEYIKRKVKIAPPPPMPPMD
jgi:hypothetical protein